MPTDHCLGIVARCVWRGPFTYNTCTRIHDWGRGIVQRKLTITVHEDIYRGLHEQIGRGDISGFIERLVRSHIYTGAELEEGYRAMAADEEREREALECSEALIGETLE